MKATEMTRIKISCKSLKKMGEILETLEMGKKYKKLVKRVWKVRTEKFCRSTNNKTFLRVWEVGAEKMCKSSKTENEVITKI